MFSNLLILKYEYHVVWGIIHVLKLILMLKQKSVFCQQKAHASAFILPLGSKDLLRLGAPSLFKTEIWFFIFKNGEILSKILTKLSHFNKDTNYICFNSFHAYKTHNMKTKSMQAKKSCPQRVSN